MLLGVMSTQLQTFQRAIQTSNSHASTLRRETE